MKIPCAFLALILAAAPLAAQEDEKKELTPYSVTEINDFLSAFKSTYKKKGVPEEDAISVLADLMSGHAYLASKGEEATKEERKAMEAIVAMVSRGLTARKRPLLTVQCVRALDKIRDPASGKAVLKWLTKVLDDKAPNPQFVEYGFLALAHIGSQDNRALDLVLKYGTTGKHVDMTVASQALKAASEYRMLKGKVRKEFFKKILGYVKGLESGTRHKDPKKRAGFDSKYNAVKDNGILALSELSGTGKKLNLQTASEFYAENKNSKWPDYAGPQFRKKEEKKPEKKEDKDTAG